MKRTPLERFLAHVTLQRNGCWLWTGPSTGLMIDGRRRTPRQLAWTLVGCRPLKDARYVTTCGNAACVRLGHLDEVNKPAPRRPGRRLPDTTISSLRRLRKEGHTLSKLAARFGLSVSGVSRIVNNDRRSTT